MNDEPAIWWSAIAPAILVGSTLVSTLLILALRPLLTRYAMALPNARSSHKSPTPQGGGIAVVVTVIAVSCAAFYFFSPGAVAVLRFPILCAAVVLIAGVGVIADIHSEYFVLRLLLQAVAVAIVVVALPPRMHVLPFLPVPAERAALVVGGVWFLNLVNFMDGLDLMTVVEIVPVAGGIAILGLLGTLPAPAIAISLALCGAMAGFAFFNRPVASLFLGDVGSLPIGLIVGWLLVLLAGNGAGAAAALLPLYYLADSSITLIRRAFNGEKIWQAHRSHFYQRATDRGFSVPAVVSRIFATNLALAALALATVLAPSYATDIAALGAGAALVSWLLLTLSRGRHA